MVTVDLCLCLSSAVQHIQAQCSGAASGTPKYAEFSMCPDGVPAGTICNGLCLSDTVIDPPPVPKLRCDGIQWQVYETDETDETDAEVCYKGNVSSIN